MYKLLYVIIFLFIFPIVGSAKLSFDHISVVNGLSQSTVLSIRKDHRGFMWFGTRDGLNRYDGRTIKQYKNDPTNPNSLISDDYIYTIAEDQRQKLWIGTQKGLSYYSPRKDSFEQINYEMAGKTDPSLFAVLYIFPSRDGKIWFGTNDGLFYFENAESREFKWFSKSDGLAGNEIYSIYEDAVGNIWVGTVTGLSKLTPSLDKETYTIKSYFNDENDPMSLSANFVRTIAEDNKGQIWLGMEKGGVNLYQSSTDRFKRYTTENSRLTNDIVRKIYVTKDGIIWIGTMDGLHVYHPFTDSFAVYRQDPDNSKSINDNSIKDIYEDNNGSIWLGTNFGGVNVAHKNTLVFDLFKNNSYTSHSISGNLISVMAKDNQGNLWVGTEGRGLNRYHPRTGSFHRYVYKAKSSHSIGSNTVKSIYVDKNNNIWVGLFEGGLELYDPQTDGFIHFRPNASDPHALNHGYISAIDGDADGKIWIGTSNKGLNIFDPITRVFSHINTSTVGRGLTSDYIRDILIDSKGNVWVATVLGINLLKKGETRFVSFVDDNNGLTSRYINCIAEDAKGNIWIGAHKGGLSVYDAQRNRFKNYSEEDGLVSNNVVAINFDRENNVWASTDNGLSVLNVEKQAFKTYTISDGLPSNEFSVNSSARGDDDKMYFGSYNGLVSFEPTNIRFNNNPPKIVFAQLRLFNQPVDVNTADGILDEDISFEDQLVFKASQNIFSIDFIAFNYINSERNQYAYKLEGFEQEWNYVDNPSASYTNLPAGTYTLLVKAANNDGVWTEIPKELAIKVLPPVYKTWWAYSLYIALFILLWYQVNKFLRRQQKLETELYYEHINHEKQEELYQNKLEFFTRISHEIRTPLTLIFAPLGRLIESTKQDTFINKQLYGIKANTERLLHLITELLDFRKIDTGNLQLRFQVVDLQSYCRHIFDFFGVQAEAKGINLAFASQEHLFVKVDPQQMEKVIFNLISNALKHTREGGQITLRLRHDENSVFIDVEDNGIGIPLEDQEKIFDNFYQSKNDTGQSTGWGIGLALAHHIVELHQGEITLTSREESVTRTGMTCFTVRLNREKVTEHDTINSVRNLPVQSAFDTEQPWLRQDVHVYEVARREEKPHAVLIVEDNDELRKFLAQALSGQYHILEAQDGAMGLDIALKEIPDIIISDVTMPHMDGFAFCRHVKQAETTSHIPVIMLTAMASDVHQIEGLQHGANIYLTKPFSVQLLELHISNLIKSTDALKEKFGRQVTLMPNNVEIEHPEEKFLHKLVNVVEDHMEDTEFNVAALVDHMGMSQTVLYKKIKTLTGMTIIDFIKSLRLKRAAQLLAQQKLHIGEVAYSVGFNDRKYFSKEFKKQFGKSPSEYIEHVSAGK